MNKIKSAFAVAFGELVFDRVESLNLDTFLSLNKYTPVMNGTGEFDIAIQSLPQNAEFTPEEFRQIIEDKWLKFDGETKSGYVFDSKDFCEPLFNKGLFKFKKAQTQIPPRVQIKGYSQADLICGFVDKNGQFTDWFICSEQFYLLWKVIMGRTKIARKKLMSGNRLNTNSFRKWMLACKTYGVEMRFEDAYNRYWKYRFERCAIEHVHIYSAIALMVIYGELPNKKNIPINHANGPVMRYWDLPANFVSNILRAYSPEITYDERKGKEFAPIRLWNPNLPTATAPQTLIKYTENKKAPEALTMASFLTPEQMRFFEKLSKKSQVNIQQESNKFINTLIRKWFNDLVNDGMAMPEDAEILCI